MRIAMIGTGYVGLVSGACFADFGHEVTCVDKDASKIAALHRGEIPIFEPGLDELVATNVKAKRLDFTTDLAEPVAEADAVFIAVGTPSRRGDGHADLSYVYAAALVGGTDDDAIREFEIANRRTLAQEFGIRGDHDVGLRIGLADDALDLVAGTDRHGRLRHHHREAGQRFCDLARGHVDVAEVGMAVAAARRRADRDEHRVRLRHGPGEIGREVEALGLDIGGDEFVEAGLVDRNLAAMQGGDLAGILVHAGDLVAEIRKTGAGNQPHIARANHGNSHEKPASFG